MLSRLSVYDILIKNGEVHDPGRGFRSRSDVAILDGKSPPSKSSIAADRALDVIDAKGLYVTPASSICTPPAFGAEAASE
jgi:predicted amidohydrolase